MDIFIEKSISKREQKKKFEIINLQVKRKRERVKHNTEIAEGLQRKAIKQLRIYQLI